MKNTVENMKIIVKGIDMGMKNRDEKAVKTLVDSYSNLLSSVHDNVNENYISEIEKQLFILTEVKDAIDIKLIKDSVINGNYKQTHSLTLTTGRLSVVICSLKDLLYKKLYPKIQTHTTYFVSDEKKIDCVRNKYKGVEFYECVNEQLRYKIKNKTESIMAIVYDESLFSYNGETVYIDKDLKNTLIMEKVKAANIKFIDVYSI